MIICRALGVPIEIEDCAGFHSEQALDSLIDDGGEVGLNGTTEKNETTKCKAEINCLPQRNPSTGDHHCDDRAFAASRLRALASSPRRKCSTSAARKALARSAQLVWFHEIPSRIARLLFVFVLEIPK